MLKKKKIHQLIYQDLANDLIEFEDHAPKCVLQKNNFQIQTLILQLKTIMKDPSHQFRKPNFKNIFKKVFAIK